MNEQPILTAADFPTPSSAARTAAPRGTEVVLADGHTWTLADHVPSFTEVWDRIYDDNLVASHYPLEDVWLAAVRLLLANYDLPADFAAWLIASSDVDPLARAIEYALFGTPNVIRSWSDWAAGALWSNGIDPATIPPPILRLVLDQLVGSGRAVAHGQFTTAGIAAAKRQHLFDRFAAAGIKPSSPAETNPS